LVVEDVRGKVFIIKFDPLNYPGIETATNFIVNRLFWGFGYHVPEDHIFFFKKEDFLIEPDRQMIREALEGLLEKVPPPRNGRYRATASLRLDGITLGHIPDHGIRKDDPNDRIPHEDRRVLRGLKVFSAFTNHTFMRVDNTLDVYVEEPGQGHVQHFLIDFTKAFGSGAARSGYTWGGFTHVFSYMDISRNLLSLGLTVKDWEKLKETPWISVGTFESNRFDPEEWKEILPYFPMRRSRPADDYWSAKILGALTEEHIRALVEAAHYPEAGAGAYIMEVLMERRRKTLAYYLKRVSPIEAEEVRKDGILFKDTARQLLSDRSGFARYEIHYLDPDGKTIAPGITVQGTGPLFLVPIPQELEKKSGGYLKLEVRKHRAGRKRPPAAEFHIRWKEDASIRLAGVVH